MVSQRGFDFTGGEGEGGEAVASGGFFHDEGECFEGMVVLLVPRFLQVPDLMFELCRELFDESGHIVIVGWLVVGPGRDFGGVGSSGHGLDIGQVAVVVGRIGGMGWVVRGWGVICGVSSVSGGYGGAYNGGFDPERRGSVAPGVLIDGSEAPDTG